VCGVYIMIPTGSARISASQRMVVGVIEKQRVVNELRGGVLEPDADHDV
jgi:hypothetical protein